METFINTTLSEFSLGLIVIGNFFGQGSTLVYVPGKLNILFCMMFLSGSVRVMQIHTFQCTEANLPQWLQAVSIVELPPVY